ncbi:hypothetical protein K438DRAFT_1986866 [Mycena galopus ATCC 62051]|nr:hypothetical protein K438DRAFT_1986866 [Mycena galopus ATCC 62051]
MTSPADRFPIPGGNLELVDSYDDEHEDNMAQVHPLPSPPPISSQIMHLTPVDLSSVLCRISHPLASRTAEYVRALNLSGNAFRNLDLSALNVLSNHDPAMVNQLLRIQSGVLPCSLPLEEHDGAGNESLSLNASGPSNVDPSKTSFSAESSASDGFSPHSTSTSSSTSINISPAISESPGPRSLNIQSSGVDDPQSQRSLADPSIAHSNDEVAGLVVPLGHATRSVPGADLDGCCQSLFASCATVTTTSGSEPSMNPQRSEAKMSTASSGTDTLQPLPDQPSTVSNEMAVQVRSLDGSTPSHLSPSIQPKSPQVDGSAESELETHCNTVDSGAHGTFSQAEASSDVSAGVSGETGTLNSGQGTSPSVTADSGFSESDISSLDQSGAMSKTQGPPYLSYSARPTSPIHVYNAPDKSSADSDPNERGLFSGPTSAPLSQQDIVTSASSTSAAEPDRGGDPSFLEFDLLHFSPFSLPAQLVHVHDTQMPSSELGKVGACPLSGGTANLMTCEEESQFRIGSASATSSKIALCPKEIVPIHGFTSNPFHSTAESQSTPADLRDVGAHPPHYKNINHGNGDGSPAFYMGEAASECRHDHANQVGSDVYSTCSQAETAVDSLRHYGIEEGSGTCDDNGLGHVSLAGSSPSDSSSARPCGSESLICQRRTTRLVITPTFHWR